ncbi:DUF4367 domain-containing protein [Pontibacillus yanchengensis]|uniref:DUF4367 domain-containing protein n=1 Tax=Pontibacillus yanchengensis Y32 TaxID=1385514 RepID=A0A0A2T7V9_9BACI|nr:DUF4367 domain-containing protein [Pontibacillus yanchengensis]KGP71624.1 hypothetical protein N782_17900 [Pontibacillus yanchengensis Y32]
MIKISQRLLMVFFISLFMGIGVLGLIRAEKVVIPQEALEASDSIELPEPLTKVSNVIEIENAVGYAVPTLNYLPTSYEFESMGFRASNQSYLVRQTYINPGKGHLTFEQKPSSERDQKIGFEEKIINFDTREIALYSKNGDIYEAVWETPTYVYSLSSVRPFPLEEWKKIIIGLK